jgi:hypothetical protein
MFAGSRVRYRRLLSGIGQVVLESGVTCQPGCWYFEIRDNGSGALS